MNDGMIGVPYGSLNSELLVDRLRPMLHGHVDTGEGDATHGLSIHRPAGVVRNSPFEAPPLAPVTNDAPQLAGLRGTQHSADSLPKARPKGSALARRRNRMMEAGAKA